MPQIYTVDHPQYQPGNPSKHTSPSFAHQLIFGDSVEESFPAFLVIKTHHRSNWNWYDSSWSNKIEDHFVDAGWIAELGKMLRSIMTDDVIVFNREVEYFFDTQKPGSSFPIYEKDYYKTDENNDLIRLPANCHVNFTLIRFRQPSDKDTFINMNILMNDNKFEIDDEPHKHYNIKYGTRYSDAGREIMCPCCKVNFNEEKYKNSKNGDEG